MKQTSCLIKINRVGNICRNGDVILTRFPNTVYLDSEPYRDAPMLQLAGQCNGLGCTPTVAEEDDFWLSLLSRAAQHVVKGLIPGMIAKHLHIDRRAITVAKMRRKLHLGVPCVVVPDKASNKSDDDRFTVVIHS